MNALSGYFVRYSRTAHATEASDRDLLLFHSRSCWRGASFSPPFGSYSPPSAVGHQYFMSMTDTSGARFGSARIASCMSFVQLSEMITFLPVSFCHSATVSSQNSTKCRGPVNSSPT